MARSLAARIAAGLLVAGVLAGCAGGRSTTSTTAGPPTVSTAAPRQGQPAAARGCPVTVPGRVGPAGVSPSSFFGWGSSSGNGKLWVGGLWPDGVIDAGPEFVTSDGAVSMKFGWWRKVEGTLRITGRRLDGEAPPLRGYVPDGYGKTGFQASGVDFPTEGCWEVTGTVGAARLTFVTYVVKRGA
jgi:hypothetical protein